MSEQCTEHMQVAYAGSNASRICTDGRNGRDVLTEMVSHLPETTSSSVTRTRAYGDFSLADFEANPADTPSDLQDTRDRADAEVAL